MANSTGDNGNYQDHITELFSLGIVPIINENDIVTTNEQSRDIIIKDNDTMAAIVGIGIGANRLEIVSAGINGYIANYGTGIAEIVEEMNLAEITEAISREEGNALTTTFGTGGILTKLEAFEIFLSSNERAEYGRITDVNDFLSSRHKPFTKFTK